MGKEDKYFVERRNVSSQEKLKRFMKAEPLYGTAARVGADGNILIMRWREGKRGTINSEDYSSLTKRQRPDSAQMRQGLKSKSVSSSEVVEFDNVEAAIRSVCYILEGQQHEERQAEVILQRTRYLIDFFQEHELSKVPLEQRRALQEETIAMLSDVGLDPESVELEVKMLMIFWTVKGSLGQDTRNRDNEMITEQALRAAQRRARQRKQAVLGNITLKYTPIGGAFALARTTARETMFEVGDEVDRRLLPNVYLDNPEIPVWKDIDHTIKKIDALSEMLEDVLVMPYRPIALMGKGYLEQTKFLLERRTSAALSELHERGFVQGIRQTMSLDPEIGDFGRTLLKNAYVYPENPS
ncbi:MAG: hypothetical protein A3A65_04300 [Candidatus Chisholmbacteria bacterium RIFCSPLOWO2_01_FULL_49_14]|uniref:Uncharacterized protein n=1 Tax=Candidatus Chisholmbacteria bacterium RIFCSPLOWO2_01_FULL_49_14 TaxID=1797593 RepID=A0A1G1VVI1_9BACT|nr:MAG: hypothetical protein A3A65_04300 [Candidatus Chisholmbacteria bacterium RIFCSPLOWO2_01_FULL_49_14]